MMAVAKNAEQLSIGKFDIPVANAVIEDTRLHFR